MTALTVAALGEAQPGPAVSIRTKVYVDELKPSSGTQKSSLNDFTRQLFQLRFQAVPEIEAAENGEVAPCGDAGSGLAQTQAQLGTRSTDRQQPASFIPTYYRVRGTVDFHSATPFKTQSNILLSYELVKVTNCQSSIMYRRARTFSMADVLQGLEDVSDEIAKTLSDDAADKVVVKVNTIEALGDPKGTYRASELLTRFVRQSVTDSKVLRLGSDTSPVQAGYTLTGTVQFSSAGSAGVVAKARFSVNGQALPIGTPDQTLKPTPDALIPYYLDLSSAAVNAMSAYLYSQRAGLNRLPSNSPEALIQRAQQLLCVNATTGYQTCTPDPKAALAALTEAQKSANSTNRTQVLALIGRARFQSGEYNAAGDAFDEGLTGPGLAVNERLSLLLQAGNAWYEAKQFAKAAERYRDCVQTADSDSSLSAVTRLQAEARVKLVRSLTLAYKSDAALDALLDGLTMAHNWPNPDDKSQALYDSLSGELSRVIDGLPANMLQPALSNVESRLSFDPKLEVLGLVRLSQAFVSNGKPDQAIAGCRKAIALQPDNAEAHYLLGDAYIWTAQYADAVIALQKAIALNPNEAKYFNDLGVSLAGEGKYDDAIAAYRKATQLHNGYTLALNNLGWTLTTKGKYEEAENAYRQAIQAQPSDTGAYNLLWSLYRTRGNQESADEVLRDLQKVAPNNPTTQSMIAEKHMDGGDFLGAAQIFSKLHEQNPEDPAFFVGFVLNEIEAGVSSQDDKLVRNAVQQLQQDVNTKPSYRNSSALGFVYMMVPQFRDLDKSKLMYDKALQYIPDDANARMSLALIALLKGDFDGAVRGYEKVLELNPREPNTLENLGYAQFLSGDLHGALESFKTGLAVAKGDTGLEACYGEALLWSDTPSQAHEPLIRALETLTNKNLESWIRIPSPRYDPATGSLAVYYITVPQKRAMLELLDAVAYLRELNVPVALGRLRAATSQLNPTLAYDQNVVRKAINDLHRLEREQLPQPTAAFGLAYLYDWLGNKSQAAHFWELYLKSGTDPLGLDEARRRRSSKPMVPQNSGHL